MSQIDIYDLEKGELEALVAEMGQPRYRASQVWHWLYRQYEIDFDLMVNLPKQLRRDFAERMVAGRLEAVTTQRSSDGQTEKFLFRLVDGYYVETVLMRYEKRRTLCISTQSGCAMGCVFCATGQMGFFRNLTVGEIVGQVMFGARLLAADGQQVTNIVMMGMGEPLHNYRHTMQALDRLTDSEGFGLGARRITISTVGLVPAMRRYADERRQTPLAVSLHAATDAERDKLIPLNRRWPISKLMEACHYYIEQTGRRLTFEWALIEGQNDTLAQAHLLGELLRGMKCHVNLIPLNPTRDFAGRPADARSVDAFRAELGRYGISNTVRVRRGIDIQAGCGQLRDRVVAISHSGSR